MLRLLPICALLAIHGFLSAQTVTGSWYGHADVDMAGIHNNYLTELVIKQKGDRVEGIFGYYFRDKYQSFFIHGRYNPQTREITIDNIPVTFYASTNTVNSVDCNTNFRGILLRSRAGSTVRGALYSDSRYRYTCPTVKVNYILDKSDNQTDSTITAGVANARIWKPQADDLVINAVTAAPPAGGNPAQPAGTPDSTASAPGKATTANDPATTASAKATSAHDTTMTAPDKAIAAPDKAAKTDKAATMDKAAATPVKSAAPQDKPAATPEKPAAASEKSAATPDKPAGNRDGMPGVPELADKKQIEESFTKRKPVVSRILEVESDSIRLSFYDNGEIDGDSISVFINNRVVLTHKELAAKAFNMFIRLDSTREVNEISMFAENLGRIPPNTALMVLTDGKNRYEVFMSSSLTQNATIQVKRRKPKAALAAATNQ